MPLIFFLKFYGKISLFFYNLMPPNYSFNFYIVLCQNLIIFLISWFGGCWLKGYPLQVKHKQDWDYGFILLLPLAAGLIGSDAGSDGEADGFIS